MFDRYTNRGYYGGRSRIRTHDTREGMLVFKTRAINHSAILPYKSPVRKLEVPADVSVWRGLVRVERFELPTLWSQTRCATRLRYTRIIGASRWYRSNVFRLSVECSTFELQRLHIFFFEK